jgi:multiple sugar transport system permease protein
MAFAAMITIPVLLLFLYLQDTYVNTVARSGIK